MRIALPGVGAFSTAMLVATLLHWDRFHHGTLLFYGWLVIYVVTPFLVPVAYWLNRRRDPGPRAGELLLPQGLRLGLAAIGLADVVFSLAMILSLATFGAIWPWTLTPLMSRVIGGWFLLPGAGLLAGVFEPRYSAYRPSILGTALWLTLVLIGSLLHLGEFDFSRPLAWLWFPVLAIAIVLAAGLYIYYERQRVATGGPAAMAG